MTIGTIIRRIARRQLLAAGAAAACALCAPVSALAFQVGPSGGLPVALPSHLIGDSEQDKDKGGDQDKDHGKSKGDDDRDSNKDHDKNNDKDHDKSKDHDKDKDKDKDHDRNKDKDKDRDKEKDKDKDKDCDKSASKNSKDEDDSDECKSSEGGGGGSSTSQTPPAQPQSGVQAATIKPSAAAPVPSTGGSDAVFVAGGLLLSGLGMSGLTLGAKRRARESANSTD